ncbi:MAG TPA: heavy-metal-associated domain-containing protein [Bellilinea sp.]|nr:heavy-metal-associated domain-containing protein [Bellilinea sp.]
MSTITYTVPGIHCDHCVHTIKMEVGDLAGVQTVSADLDSKVVVVTYDTPASEDKIEALLAEINYPVQK